MNFSIIIPAHNEESSIKDTISSIEKVVSAAYEIVVVDDHSSDRTADIVEDLVSSYKNIRLVRNNDEAGFANALRAGFASAESDIVIPVMADLCDDPDTIEEMYKKAQEGFDIVCGSRYMKDGRKIGGPLIKTFFSRFVGLSLRALIGIPTQDISNSFKLYRKEIIENIKDIEAKGFEISVELPLKAYFLGYKITELPTVWVNRKTGNSKFKIFKQGPRYLRLYLWAIWKKITGL